jgi:hypothetical protein
VRVMAARFAIGLRSEAVPQIVRCMECMILKTALTEGLRPAVCMLQEFLHAAGIQV